MSEKSFIEKMAAKRHSHMEALLKVPDGDSHSQARIRGHIHGLDEAMTIYRNENKSDDEEGKTG